MGSINQMYQLPDEAVRILEKIDARVRMVHTGADMKRDEHGDWAVAKAGRITAHIIDNTTGEDYCTEDGIDEPDAIVKACRKALTAPKPMTKAQKATAGRAEEHLAKVVSEKDDAIAALQAELAALKAAKAPAPAPAKPPVDPDPKTAKPK